MNKALVALLFSKDRAFQLDATLRSFARALGQEQPPVTKVIYAASSPAHEESYRVLAREIMWVEFIRETEFRTQLLEALAGYEFALFMVDDNIFVRSCSLVRFCRLMDRFPEAIAFSLRLGRNTQYCYPLNRPQALPSFVAIEPGILHYQWPGQEADFGYPLEVSSSMYRVRDIGPLLEQLSYQHPNSFEAAMAQYAHLYAKVRPGLLCCEQSLTFCAPINRVQDVVINRAGESHGCSASELLQLFTCGVRLDISRYQGHVPGSCHEEVPLFF